MNKKLVELIKEEFEKIISTKTGWGKNDIIKAHNEAIANAVLRFLDNE